MLKKTHDRIYHLFEEAGGYMPTRNLINQGVSTVHIRELLESGDIEKVSHGNYWAAMLGIKKPDNYRMIEACMTNSKAVICGPSACYYHGLLKKEPEKLYVATARTDRGNMALNFPVSRHYFSEKGFKENIETFTQKKVTVKIYGADRSVCDCIRLADRIDEKILGEIINAYKNYPKKDIDLLINYADRMRVGHITREMLSDCIKNKD